MADRYWVGGSANWDATAGTKWALTSGGAGGQAVPTASDDVYIDSGSGAVTVTVATATATCRNLSFTSGAGDFAGTFAGSTAATVSGDLTLVAGMTNSYTGTITFNSTTSQTITTNGKAFASSLTFDGVAGSWALQDNLTTGTGNTVTVTNGTLNINGKILSAGRFLSSNTNARTLAFGAGSISVTGNNATVWDTSVATNLTISGTSPTVNCTYSGATGSRNVLGATTGVTEARCINLNVTAGTDTVNIYYRWINIDLTGFAGTVGNIARHIYGNLNISTGATLTAGTNATNFVASVAGKTITTNGKTLDFPIVFVGAGSWTLQDNLTVGTTRSLSFLQGTFIAGAKNVTMGSFVSSGASARVLNMGSGIWTITAAGTAWNVSGGTNYSVTPGTATISMTAATAKSFTGGQRAYPTLNQGGAGALTIVDSNTFNNITNTVQPATITFTAGTTTTVKAFTVSGTAGNLITLGSTTTSAANLYMLGAGYINVNYLSISYINASPAGIWYAGANSTDGGNNTGWIFTAAPSTPIGFDPHVKLRSFSDYGRF